MTHDIDVDKTPMCYSVQENCVIVVPVITAVLKYLYSVYKVD